MLKKPLFFRFFVPGGGNVRFFLNQPLKQWLTGKKRGEDEYTKVWISGEQKELFRWDKKQFSVFEGLSFGEK